MNLTSSFLLGSEPPTEPWTYSEKLIQIDEQITLRERRFGLIEILDESLLETASKASSCCEPAVVPATVENVSIL